LKERLDHLQSVNRALFPFSPSPHTLVGQTVSHYKILEHLGSGGMGVVYKAQDLKLDRTVALKFLPIELTSNTHAKNRFIQEAKAASALDHLNICTIHELGETDGGQVFMAMSCYDGTTLQMKIEQGPLKLENAIDLAMQAASGLASAHKHGIVHRDIKPANIIISCDGVVKILDFGLAKLKGQLDLTKTGATLGTALYMSPEQARGEEVDHRSDIWSLGVVLYEMLTGICPFRAEHEQAVLYRILNEDPEPVGTYRQDVSPELLEIVDRALKKDTVDRYPSVNEILRDLSRAKSQAGTGTPAPRSGTSIAVLPLLDMSPDHDQEYFCDGIAEELINALTHISGLRVIARTSSFSFKGEQRDVREIGRKLGVATLLEGSVRKADQRLRITVQLISARDGSHLWSERYDRNLEDIFAIQDDVCLSIVEHLKVTLAHGEKKILVKHRASNHEAYNLYLKGLFLFNQRKPDSVSKSIEYYSDAIKVDPTFALAFSALAVAYGELGSWRVLPLETAYDQARKASMTALRLDDSLSEVHVAAGWIRLNCDWNWSEADQEFQRALATNPACAEAHHIYAHYLELRGCPEKALAEINRALELEPVSPPLNSCAVQVLFHARQYEEAIKQCYAALELAPSYFGLFGWLGAAYAKSGMPQRGVAALKEGLRHLPEDSRLHGLLGYAYAVSAKHEKARECLEKLDSLSEKRYVDPYYMVWPLGALDDRTAAFELLNRAYDEHSGWLPWMAVDPMLDELRSDPRFNSVIERLGLQP
jgi:serine/threonine protein kinase/Flp pilus assembly protein TadD